MRSIYESAREIMEVVAKGGVVPNQPSKILSFLDPASDKKRAEARLLKTKDQTASNTLAAANIKAKDQNASNTLAAANMKAKPQPQILPAKIVTKPGEATMAAAPSQDKLNAVQRSAEKTGLDLNALKLNIAAPKVEPKVAEPKPAVSNSVEVTNREASANKPNDSGGYGSSSYTSSAGKADNNPVEKPQAAATPAPAVDNTVKSGSGGTVTTSDGSPLKTRIDDEIAKQNKKGRGAAMESVNKKFNITDALYQSVMEVMKKDKKEGSVPRNPEEEKLAAFHGDPKRITHGDVLKARGVTKEETEEVDEGMMSAAKTMAKKVLNKLGGGSDEDQRKDLQRKMGVPQTGKKPMKEGKDTPGNSYEHQCAIHVKSESYGEGRTITTQHADPDTEGNIAWYDVMFEHGIEKQVPASTLEVLVSEMHGHSKKKKM